MYLINGKHTDCNMFNRNLIKIERNTKAGTIVIYNSLACGIQDDRGRSNTNPPIDQSLLKKIIFINKKDITEQIKDRDIITDLNTSQKYRAIDCPYGGNLTPRLQLRVEGNK
jgi:hypothetical protein